MPNEIKKSSIGNNIEFESRSTMSFNFNIYEPSRSGKNNEKGSNREFASVKYTIEGKLQCKINKQWAGVTLVLGYFMSLPIA